MAAAGLAAWPWSGILLWGALGLAVQCAGYVGAGPLVYRKVDGRLSLVTILVLGPILFGQYVSLLYYRRHGKAWDEAAPGLLMGQVLDRRRSRQLLDEGATAVLDLTAEFTESKLLRESTRYCNLPILDLTAPTPGQLGRAIAFIRDNVADGIVYVHCKAGYSRSAAVVGAWLIVSGRAVGVEDAMAQMQRARSPRVVRPEVLRALRQFEASRK